MIAFLEGALAGKTSNSILLNVGGVGFEIGMPTSSLAVLPGNGERVLVHTFMHVREDDISLSGFLTLEEKELFERLISVSSVGPKVALAALSTYTSQKIVEAISNDDIAALQKIPGVGKKMASRIILELKGTLAIGSEDITKESDSSTHPAIEDATEALKAMGFTNSEIVLALKSAPEEYNAAALIKYALKRLGS